MIPATGDIVRVRSRQYLVEGVDLPPQPGESTLVRLSCLEDDAQGEPLEVLWEREIDAKLVRETDWNRIASRGFDEPRLFSAYLHTLRWNCVTATDAKVFQAPYRAGIEVKAYQLQPLRMALGMPRVNVFIADPDKHPLRILIATDAAREGVNLQNNCADLFHFDVPWNPGRIEQRNGRIDRKLQRADEVHCMYFVLPQRAEDRVLDVLMKKTGTIHKELGSLSPVIGRRIDQAFARGIEHENAEDLVSTIEKAGTEGDEPSGRVRTMQIEMGNDEMDQRRVQLERQLTELRELLDRSREWIGLDDRHFRDALSASLETVGAEGLAAANNAEAVADPDRARWLLPHLHERKGADPTWAATLDTLRAPRKKGQTPSEWRRDAPIRPVVFKDPGNLDGDVVHLHLEHRVVQRLLGRFLSQGFRDDDLRRACVLRTVEAQPRAVLLGRLSLFGEGGARLHDEVLAAAAQWLPIEQRRGKLQALGEGEKSDVLKLVEEALAQPRLREAEPPLQERLRGNAARDVSELTPHLERRATVLVERARLALSKRGDTEARDMAAILTAQRERILARQREIEEASRQGTLAFNPDEERQLAADRRHWVDRLQAIARELEAEPDRVRKSYVVKATRIEAVGIVYLWPLSS